MCLFFKGEIQLFYTFSRIKERIFIFLIKVLFFLETQFIPKSTFHYKESIYLVLLLRKCIYTWKT